MKGAIASKYHNAGQTCVCANRIQVQDGVYDAPRHRPHLARCRGPRYGIVGINEGIISPTARWRGRALRPQALPQVLGRSDYRRAKPFASPGLVRLATVTGA